MNLLNELGCDKLNSSIYLKELIYVILLGELVKFFLRHVFILIYIVGFKSKGGGKFI